MSLSENVENRKSLITPTMLTGEKQEELAKVNPISIQSGRLLGRFCPCVVTFLLPRQPFT